MTVSVKAPTSTTGSIQLNGSDVLTIDSSGNLTAPNNLTANTIIPTSSSAPTNGMFLPTTNTVGVSTNSTERMRIDSNGNVGIGTSSPARPLEVKQSGDSFISITAGNANSSVLELGDSDDINIGRILYNHGSNYLATYTNNAERMRIDSSGNVHVGTAAIASSTQSGVSLRNPLVAYSVFSSGTYTGLIYQIGFINGNGLVGRIETNGSGTAYVTSSDYRLKENNVNITDGIDRVKLLKPYRFNFIADANVTVDGFFAHEVQDIVPEAVSGDKDAVDDEGNIEPQGIDQAKLVPLLTAALQEAITKIEDLETRIQTLESANV